LASALLALFLGDVLIYFGTAMGFACPGCGLRDPGVWLYTMLPWLSGAALLAIAGWLYHRGKRPMHRVLDSIAAAFGIGLGALFLLFVVLVLITSLRH